MYTCNKPEIYIIILTMNPVNTVYEYSDVGSSSWSGSSGWSSSSKSSSWRAIIIVKVVVADKQIECIIVCLLIGVHSKSISENRKIFQ